ncbi:MAG: hypothetical protein J6T69_05830 [Methanobrevibacter sp.]|nr:hypothetical protein [Methanobrevibacter sp.]
MKQLAIYHAPQEYGEPFVMLINLEDGQPVRTINIPEGFYDAGSEIETYYEPTGEIITKKHSGNYLPVVGERECFRSNNHLCLKEILDIQPWEFDLGEGEYMKGYDATLVYEVCRRKLVCRFDSSKDTFRKEMENQGIDMTGWCVYKRRKTEFTDFLKAIMPDDVINIIKIG